MAQEQSMAGERNEVAHCSSVQDGGKAEASLCSTLVTEIVALSCHLPLAFQDLKRLMDLERKELRYTLGRHCLRLTVLFDQEASKCITFLSLCLAETRQLIGWNNTQTYILTAK